MRRFQQPCAAASSSLYKDTFSMTTHVPWLHNRTQLDKPCTMTVFVHLTGRVVARQVAHGLGSGVEAPGPSRRPPSLYKPCRAQQLRSAL